MAAKMPVIQVYRVVVVLAEEEPFHLVRNSQDTGRHHQVPYQGSKSRA